MNVHIDNHDIDSSNNNNINTTANNNTRLLLLLLLIIIVVVITITMIRMMIIIVVIIIIINCTVTLISSKLESSKWRFQIPEPWLVLPWRCPLNVQSKLQSLGPSPRSSIYNCLYTIALFHKDGSDGSFLQDREMSRCPSADFQSANREICYLVDQHSWTCKRTMHNCIMTLCCVNVLTSYDVKWRKMIPAATRWIEFNIKHVIRYQHHHAHLLCLDVEFGGLHLCPIRKGRIWKFGVMSQAYCGCQGWISPRWRVVSDCLTGIVGRVDDYYVTWAYPQFA